MARATCSSLPTEGWWVVMVSLAAEVAEMEMEIGTMHKETAC